MDVHVDISFDAQVNEFVINVMQPVNKTSLEIYHILIVWENTEKKYIETHPRTFNFCPFFLLDLLK